VWQQNAQKQNGKERFNISNSIHVSLVFMHAGFAHVDRKSLCILQILFVCQFTSVRMHLWMPYFIFRYDLSTLFGLGWTHLNLYKNENIYEKLSKKITIIMIIKK